jgi:predicted enzyme related to lactoylglutathione lyase
VGAAVARRRGALTVRLTDAPPSGVIVWPMPGSPLSLIEFPADDPERARRFWAELLGVELEPRRAGEGEGWQSRAQAPAVGVHARGRGPGDSFSLPYFTVPDLGAALERVAALGGSVIHPGTAWAVCKDSEGSPFGLAQEAAEHIKAR